MEPFDPIFAASIQQNLGPHHVRVHEDTRIRNRAIDVTFSGEIDYVVKMFFLEKAINLVAVNDVFMNFSPQPSAKMLLYF